MTVENKRCKLCSREAQLRNSHIIPEFIYKPIYDSGIHRFMSYSPGQKRIKYLQKGVREKLLCDNCEQQFGRYEKYAKEEFFENKKLSVVQKKDTLLISNLNYNKFKLFQLSILWRMSISSKLGFKDLYLGEEEEMIRIMLLNETPGKSDEYGCILYYMADHEINLNGLIISPEIFIRNEHKVLRIVFHGFTWVYFLSREINLSDYRDHILKEDGTLNILIRVARNMKFIQGHAKSIKIL